MNVKRFHYESDRSSFVYRLVVQRERVTKDAAKANGMKFNIYLETSDHTKMGDCPQSGLVSFM
ncbi:unnamed protein product [Scytosiphon promiscuus]